MQDYPCYSAASNKEKSAAQGGDRAKDGKSWTILGEMEVRMSA